MTNLTIKALALNLLILSCGSMVMAMNIEGLTLEQWKTTNEANEGFKKAHLSAVALMNAYNKCADNNCTVGEMIDFHNAKRSAIESVSTVAATLHFTCQTYGYPWMNPNFFNTTTLGDFSKASFSFDKDIHCMRTDRSEQFETAGLETVNSWEKSAAE